MLLYSKKGLINVQIIKTEKSTNLQQKLRLNCRLRKSAFLELLSECLLQNFHQFDQHHITYKEALNASSYLQQCRFTKIYFHLPLNNPVFNIGNDIHAKSTNKDYYMNCLTTTLVKLAILITYKRSRL